MLDDRQVADEIHPLLDQSVDLEHVVNPLLKAIAENMGMLRGTITLLNRQSGEIFIEAARKRGEPLDQRRLEFGRRQPACQSRRDRIVHVYLSGNHLLDFPDRLPAQDLRPACPGWSIYSPGSNFLRLGKLSRHAMSKACVLRLT